MLPLIDKIRLKLKKCHQMGAIYTATLFPKPQSFCYRFASHSHDASVFTPQNLKCLNPGGVLISCELSSLKTKVISTTRMHNQCLYRSGGSRSSQQQIHPYWSGICTTSFQTALCEHCRVTPLCEHESATT